MKIILTIVTIAFLSNFLFCQEADGYYVNKTGDTIRGKVQIPVEPKIKFRASTQKDIDPLRDETPDESKEIDYSKLTFDFKFSTNGEKFKKIDRLKVKGFGFEYKGHDYDFITWDVTANKQLYLIPPTGHVSPDGVYFILYSLKGHFPIYSLFQEVERSKRINGEKIDDGNSLKRDIIFKHPTKGFIYISNQYPLLMKFSEVLNYLEVEDSFLKSLNKKENLLEVVKKYNKWKEIN